MRRTILRQTRQKRLVPYPLNQSTDPLPLSAYNNGNPTFQTFSKREAERQTLVIRFLSFPEGLAITRLERRTMEG